MFFQQLDIHDGPVVEGLNRFEVIYAKDQPQYRPLRVICTPAKPGSDPKDFKGRVMSRWTLTQQQRQIILDGGDIYLEMYTFGNSLQPVSLAVGHELNAESLRNYMELPPPEKPMLIGFPDSSNVAWAGFDYETNRLQAVYKGGGKETPYEYTAVPVKLWRDFLTANSKGSFLARYVTGKFESKQITTEELWEKIGTPSAPIADDAKGT